MFLDKILITLVAGKGGNGIVSWHRAKYVPKGGPSGGNGGKGGSIIIVVDEHALSLEKFRNKKIIKAQNGEQGGTNNKTGKNGDDLIIKVPPGTLIKDTKTQEILFDFTKVDDTFIICKGGKGGKGNQTFRSPTNQAPDKCTLGEFGETQDVELELKLIADIGLIGMPNAGKSTLLAALSQAKVKIAPYPFTTLSPNLGVLEFDGNKKALIADIPGIIEKAHKNKGLGLTFLKHIERTNILVYVIDASYLNDKTPEEELKLLQKELFAYNPAILKKPSLVVLNKIDMNEPASGTRKSLKKNFFRISALTKEGLDNFTHALKELFLKETNKKF
jgi:GTP-binding protein